MGSDKESCPEPSPVERCGYGPMLLRESTGLSQVIVSDVTEKRNNSPWLPVIVKKKLNSHYFRELKKKPRFQIESGEVINVHHV